MIEEFPIQWLAFTRAKKTVLLCSLHPNISILTYGASIILRQSSSYKVDDIVPGGSGPVLRMSPSLPQEVVQSLHQSFRIN